MRGFSLLELSIVLVIIGLIAGGIVAGASMIRAAELRAVVTEQEQFKVAAYTFRDKYLGLPGDLRNATAFWGATASCPDTAGTGTQTCDGDGDGVIEREAATEYAETFMFWQHLANAGLISGSYTGITGGSHNNHAIIDENIPASKLSGSGWAIRDIDYSSGGNSYSFTYDYGNSFNIGCPASNNNGVACTSVTPAEAWGVDKKMDDGMPGRGKVFGVSHSGCTDSADEDDLDAEYDLANEGTVCQLRFARIF